MEPGFALITVAVVVNGLIAGMSLDAALVKLPARKRIGSVAYTRFARGNDLGNGLIVYPALGVLTGLLVFGAAVLAFATGQPASLMAPLIGASLLTIAHTLCTARAAPIMLSLRDAPDEERVLGAKLDHFAYWNTLRALFQCAAFLALVWALVVARP
jgi:hypothetical protein